MADFQLDPRELLQQLIQQEKLQPQERTFTPEDFSGDSFKMGPGESFDNSKGSFTKMKANPEADARYQRAYLMDLATNQKALQQDMESKARRLMNAEIGARTSGDDRAAQMAQMGGDKLIEQLTRFGFNDANMAKARAMQGAMGQRADLKLMEMANRNAQRSKPSAADLTRMAGLAIGGAGGDSLMVDQNARGEYLREVMAQLKVQFPNIKSDRELMEKAQVIVAQNPRRYTSSLEDTMKKMYGVFQGLSLGAGSSEDPQTEDPYMDDLSMLYRE